MSAASPTPEQQPTHAAQRARQLRLLDRSLDIAAARLERLDPTKPDAPDLPDAEAAVIYEKLTRSMRQGMLLADKLAEPIPEPKSEPKLGPAARTAARKRIIRDVEDVIHERAGTPERVENLERELLERLDAPDMEVELATRPIDAIVLDLCRDLGLRASDYKRRIPPEIDLLAEFAAAPPESLGENNTRLGRDNPFLQGKHDP